MLALLTYTFLDTFAQNQTNWEFHFLTSTEQLYNKNMWLEYEIALRIRSSFVIRYFQHICLIHSLVILFEDQSSLFNLVA